MTYLIVKLNNEHYAISSTYVKSIIETPKWIQVPLMPKFIRGALDFRNEIVNLVDTRVLIGATSVLDEVNDTLALLNAREQDHINWLKELESSLNENREFKLARDPHKCAFGKWYFSFHTDNHALQVVLDKFESPHNSIHSIADEICQLAEMGEYSQALNIINRTRTNELSRMCNLFEEARRFYYSSLREMVVVLEYNHHHLAISIDSAQDIEDIDDSLIEDLTIQNVGANVELFSKSVRIQGNIVLILNVDNLFKTIDLYSHEEDIV